MWDFKAADGLTLHPTYWAFRVSEEGCVGMGCFLEPIRETSGNTPSSNGGRILTNTNKQNVCCFRCGAWAEA